MWKEDGRRYVHATYEVEQYVKTLDLDRISGLTISRPTLEDAYLALVNGNNKHEETEAADEKAGAR